MSQRIIINIKADCVSEEMAVYLVGRVMEDGRISGNGDQWCYATRFALDGSPLFVIARDPRKTGTQTFDIVNDAHGKAGA